MERKLYKKLSRELLDILWEKYCHGALVCENTAMDSHKAVIDFSKNKTIISLLKEPIINDDKKQIFNIFENWLNGNIKTYSYIKRIDKLENKLILLFFAVIWFGSALLISFFV